MTSLHPYHTLDELLPKFLLWAEERNLILGSDPFRQTVKLMEELGEFSNGLARGDAARMADSFGDMLVIMTIIAAQTGLDLTNAANYAWHEIKDRKGQMVDGIFIKEGDFNGSPATE